MEKKKFEMNMGDTYEEQQEVQVGVEIIHVLKHIPLEQKMLMASDMAQMIEAPNDELGIVTTSSLEDVCAIYLILKYYTDVDMEGVGAQQAFDWLVGHGAVDAIKEIIEEDYDYMEAMMWRLCSNLEAEHKARHGLPYAIKTSFGFLFDGKDLTETLAESREVSDQMLDVVGRLNNAAKKEEAGMVKVSGNVINIGKKNK